MSSPQQIAYYHQRAAEYDLIYQKPERQADLQKLYQYLSSFFQDQHLIELACGTGYWTAQLSQQARRIQAIDINESVLDIARTKQYEKAEVNFQCIDYRDLVPPPILYDGLFAGFLWSHIAKADLSTFLQIALDQVRSGGSLLFLDNRFVEGSSTPISRVDAMGNTYQQRRLLSGERFEIIKNFPSLAELQTLLAAFGCSLHWKEWDYYWLLQLIKR